MYNFKTPTQRIVFKISNDDSFTLSERIVDSAILAKMDKTPPLDNPVVVAGPPLTPVPPPVPAAPPFSAGEEEEGGSGGEGRGGGKSDLEI